MQSNSPLLPNPFLDHSDNSPDDEFVLRAKSGDRDQLELLLPRQLPWLFNLTIRMLHCRADAEGATQEILLKTTNSLPGSRGEAKFLTWLNRIAVNYLLNLRKLKRDASNTVCSFALASAGLHQVPDLDPPHPRTVPPPIEILNEETGNNSLIGTLLCLDLRKVREVAAQLGPDLQDSYMQVAASVYRNHPFLEPSEQSAILRRVLPSFTI